MRSYLHAITRHQTYIEKLSLWIQIKQKDLETHINHAPDVYVSYEKRGWSLHISVKNHNTQTEKRQIYLKDFKITWQTAPSQT